ncbi:MAG: lysophospholipid acyltransferase family protein [Thermoleophilia bacterium]
MGIDLDLDVAPKVTAGWWVFGHITLVPTLVWFRRLKVEGIENVPAEGAVLLVCNHISQIDPPVLGVGLRRRRRSYYMAKIELFRPAWFGRIIRGLGAFPVERGGADRRALRIAREVLQRGDVLLMFPEGHRQRDGILKPGLPGAGSLGLLPGVTVVPAAIWGSNSFLRRVRVAIGEPLDLGDVPDGPRAGRAEWAVDRMMAAVAALLPRVGAPAQAPPVREAPADPADG